MKKIIIAAFVILTIFLLFNFVNSSGHSPSQTNTNSSTVNEEWAGEYEEDETEETQNEEENIEDEEADNSLEFNGYECTDDCSGHEAGYEWAEEHEITQEDIDNYSGNSNSFMEGMQSYVDGE